LSSISSRGRKAYRRLTSSRGNVCAAETIKLPCRECLQYNALPPDWHAAYASSRDQPVLWITSMSGMCVIDAQLHVGGRYLQPLQVYRQLTLAGIEGATFLTGPENRDLPCGSTGMSEGNDGWRHPRYLTKRGILHNQEYPYPWLPTIPATPLHHGGVRRNRWFSPCDEVRLKHDCS
jgi:hypothetical protein